jgi:uncharacterized protein YjgD (DUF1641 family)
MTDMPRVGTTAADLARLAEGFSNALSDSMVERLATTAACGLEVVDKINEPDVKDGVIALLDAVGSMHRTGVLQTVIDLVFMVHAARSAASDSMIDRVFTFIEHMANNLGTEDLATIAHEAKGAMEDALDECGQPNGGGMMGTLRMISKPETQEAMRFMIAFACSLRKRIVVISKSSPAL